MEPYYQDAMTTLYHGRCEDVMPQLEAQSFDAVSDRKIDVIPFYPHMAFMTKANDIIKRICIVHVLKRANRFNVMNICFTGSLNGTTTTASIVISEPGGALDWTPIFPIVATMPAAPVVTIRSAVAAIGAFARAKAITMRAFNRCRNSDTRFTHFASEYNCRLFGRARHHQSAFACFKVARQGTNNNVFGAHLCWLTRKCAAAYLACQLSILNTWRYSQGIRASAATGGLPTML